MAKARLRGGRPPKILNIAKVKGSLAEPVLLHFTVEQWKRVVGSVKPREGAPPKVPANTTLLTASPVAGGQEGYIVDACYLEREGAAFTGLTLRSVEGGLNPRIWDLIPERPESPGEPADMTICRIRIDGGLLSITCDGSSCPVGCESGWRRDPILDFWYYECRCPQRPPIVEEPR